MHIPITKPLFPWECLTDPSDLRIIKQFFDLLPDHELLYSLRRFRGRDRLDRGRIDPGLRARQADGEEEEGQGGEDLPMSSQAMSVVLLRIHPVRSSVYAHNDLPNGRFHVYLLSVMVRLGRFRLHSFVAFFASGCVSAGGVAENRKPQSVSGLASRRRPKALSAPQMKS